MGSSSVRHCNSPQKANQVPRKRWVAKPSKAFGCDFRSRLEVRWACLLTVLGWDWKYEPYVVKVSKRKHYLCDFLVTNGSQQFWLEIKPKYPTRGEIKKALGQVQVTGICLAFGIGSPMHGAKLEWVMPAHTPVSSANPFSVVTHRTLQTAATLYDSLDFEGT